MRKAKLYISLVVIILTISSCDFFKNREKLPKTAQYIKLIGKWKVTKSSFLPFEHPSYCEKIGLNSIFEFDEYGILKVYENDKTNRNCNRSQKFWILENELIAFEYDVGFPYEILKLTSDTLVLKSENIPDFLFKEDKIQTIQGLESDDIKFISANGIIITLRKVIRKT